eukprot:g378.t1
MSASVSQQQQQQQQEWQRRPIPVLHNFIYSSVAASTAVIFTNPVDVAKTRLQLQGEGARAHSKKVYTGPVDCIIKTIRVEGFAGAQRGLTTAIAREAVLNFFRIGAYEPILRLFHKGDGPPPLWKKIAGGITTGSIASLVANPLDLLKTRMQSQASGENAQVGHQHRFAGAFDGFRQAIANGGVASLWRGLSASMLRLALGSSAQLASYSQIKEIATLDYGVSEGVPLHIGASFGSVVFGVTAMNPVDVIRTRLYNQPIDGLYKSGVDCAMKIAKTEGLGAFFKGWGAHYFRGAPHVALIFVTLEWLKKERPLERMSSM